MRQPIVIFIKSLGCAALLLLGVPAALAGKTQNVVLIVSDGLRWQEVFGGADTALIARRQGVEDTAAIRRDFARPTIERSRLELMPFMWSVVARQGQIYGNRALGSDGHKPTADGAFTVEPVYCLGLCASSPSMAIDGKVHARINVEKFNKLVSQARSHA